MRGCGVRTLGGAVEVLELPEPRQPGPGEILLAVEAAGIGSWDRLLRNGGWNVGLAPPAALGVEGTGTVLAVGEDVAGRRVGDAVLVHEAPLPGGCGFWAERVLITAAHTAPRPPTLDPDRAGGLPVAGLTALQALDALEVRSGERVLITGASGPTAALALQLASRAGAEVVATAALRHADRLRRLGATEVVDSHERGWAGRVARRFDAALIASSGTASAAISLIDDGGRLCSITSDAPPGERRIQTLDLYVRPDGTQLTRLARLVAEGRLKFNVQAVEVDQAPIVANRVASGTAGGTKYVLRL